MRESGTDPAAPAKSSTDGELLSQAKFAEQVTTLTGEGAPGLRGGDLPMWNRVQSPPPSSLFRRVVVIAAWCVALGLVAVAALRILWHDGATPLIWVNAFTLYIYLPAYFLLAFAAATQRWWLAMASAVVVACHLTWVLPDFRPATPFVRPVANPATEPRSLRIFYANVLGSNTNLDGMLGEAMRAKADVIVLAELHRWWFRQLAKNEAIATFPYGTNLKRRHMGDVNVFSKLPVSRQHLITSAWRVTNVVDIPLGEETLRLVCLHSPRPIFDGLNQYTKFWEEMRPVVASQQEPLVVLGDINATQHSLLYEQLTSGRLRSAHDDRGRSYATTWPNGRKPLPPIRIDQVFLSPQVECVSIQEGEGPGSDHKPLIIDLTIHSTKPVAD